MFRISIFVDYSNLMGSLKKINIRVEDYQSFFYYIAEQACQVFKASFLTTVNSPLITISRVYWYVVGDGSDYDFALDSTKDFFKQLFDDNREIKSAFIATASQKNPGLSPSDLYNLAFEGFFTDRKDWYDKKWANIESFRDFYEMVRKKYDFIEINECGFWKMDFISKDIDEKGTDTALAVDCVTMAHTFDVALIVSGDADMIPSVNYLKHCGKTVGIVSMIKGYPPEKKGRQQSERLSRVADFVVPIYEMDLQRKDFIIK